MRKTWRIAIAVVAAKRSLKCIESASSLYVIAPRHFHPSLAHSSFRLGVKTNPDDKLDLPLKSPEHRCSLRRRAYMSEADPVAQEHCKSDESGKPEQHRHCFRSQDGEFVVRDRVGEAPWHDDQVEEYEDRPDGAKEEEVDLAGTERVPVVRPPICDCCAVSESQSIEELLPASRL